MTIAIAGGTGRLGSLARRLSESGLDVRVITRDLARVITFATSPSSSVAADVRYRRASAPPCGARPP